MTRVFRASYGTARCDFPGGDAEALYHSVRRLYALPAHTRLHFCHDYPPVGSEPVESQTVAELRARNVQLCADTTREEFVAYAPQPRRLPARTRTADSGSTGQYRRRPAAHT